MIQQLINLMGQAINSPDMKAFLEEYGFQYPVKDTQSVKITQSFGIRDDTPTLYLSQQALGIDLLFETIVWHPQYPLILADRKGVFYYRLQQVWFLKETCEAEMLAHLGISCDTNIAELKSKFGKPKELKITNTVPWCGEMLAEMLAKMGIDGINAADLEPKPTPVHPKLRKENGDLSWCKVLDVQKDIVAKFNFRNGMIGRVWLEIPDRPFFTELPTPELLNVIGKPINAPEVKAFIEKYGGTYPSKDTICTAGDPTKGKTCYAQDQLRAQRFDLQLHGLPLGIMEFGLHSDDIGVFSPVVAAKKDHYYPVLTCVAFKNDHQNGLVNLPKGATSADSSDTLREKLGVPDMETGANCMWNVLFENDSKGMSIQFRKEANYYGVVQEVSFFVNSEEE